MSGSRTWEAGGFEGTPLRIRSQSSCGAAAGRSSARRSSRSLMAHSQLLLERGEPAVVAVLEGLLGNARDDRRVGERQVAPDLENDRLALVARDLHQGDGDFAPEF